MTMEEQFQLKQEQTAMKILSLFNQVAPTDIGKGISNALGTMIGMRSQVMDISKHFTKSGEAMSLGSASAASAFLFIGMKGIEMWKQAHDRAIEIAHKTAEAIEKQKSALVQQAREVGNAMGSEMSKGLILDPQTFLKQMVQSQMAKILGDIFSTSMATPCLLYTSPSPRD